MDSAATSDVLNWGRRKGIRRPRKKVVGGAMTLDEKESVLRAMIGGPFENPSDGVRKILFAYRDSTAVRDAVAEALRTLKVA